MANKKPTNAYAKISKETIVDSLLAIEGWFEYNNMPAEAKQASDLFDVVWKMLENPMPKPAQPAKPIHAQADQWIAEMQAAGFSVDDMLACIKEAQRQYTDYKKRKEAKHGTQHSNTH